MFLFEEDLGLSSRGAILSLFLGENIDAGKMPSCHVSLITRAAAL